ncbi:MAG: hypothetical protein GIW99_12395 [Candidatus Eremiobacteraeota bacterium]|nr:hypothetical protein [Candidatus Eremiobacteraeota bacterium]
MIDDSTITLSQVEFQSDVVAHYLSGVSEEDRPKSLVKALEVGVYCLERVSAINDVDFVRARIDRLLKDVQRAALEIPGATGALLASKMGVGSGQLLEPFAVAANDVRRAVDEKVQQVRALLENDIDPKNDRSTLGQSLKEIKSLLDPKHLDSIPCALERACQSLTKGDGELIKSVRDAVGDHVREIVRRIDTIEKHVDIAEKIDEALSNTTAAGRPFEDSVLDKLTKWAQSCGAETEHVGTDNRPGDVLIKVPRDPLGSDKIAIIVEAKHKKAGAGRKQIGDSLRTAMETRQACAAVYVCHSTDGFAREIGDWAEGCVNGHGPWVATTMDNLTTAVRFLAAIVQLSELRSSQARIDTHFISQKVNVLRQSLAHFTNIQTKLTGIVDGVDYIRGESRSARELIHDAISEIEQALRAGQGEAAELLATTTGTAAGEGAPSRAGVGAPGIPADASFTDSFLNGARS